MSRVLNYNTDGAKSAVRATVALALGKALITGIDNCEAEGHALTQVQQIDLAVMYVMAYDEAIQTCMGIDLEAKLLDIAQ